MLENFDSLLRIGHWWLGLDRRYAKEEVIKEFWCTHKVCICRCPRDTRFFSTNMKLHLLECSLAWAGALQAPVRLFGEWIIRCKRPHLQHAQPHDKASTHKIIEDNFICNRDILNLEVWVLLSHCKDDTHQASCAVYSGVMWGSCCFG